MATFGVATIYRVSFVPAWANGRRVTGLATSNKDKALAHAEKCRRNGAPDVAIDETTVAYNVRLSAAWMNDHLDCWPDQEIDRPDGAFIGSTWVGMVNDAQRKEIISRASHYTDAFGPDACEDGGRLKSAARRVLKALGVQ